MTNTDQNPENDSHEFYRENPLYDVVDLSVGYTPDSETYPLNTIDRYFSVRSHVNQLEQHLKQGNLDSTKNQVPILYLTLYPYQIIL